MTMYATDKKTLTQDGVRAEGHHLRKKYCSSRKLKIEYLLIHSMKPIPISKQDRKYTGEKEAIYQYS